MGVKKFRKFYETQKQRLIKWIHEYIKTNKNTFTTKEVARFLNLKWNTEYSEATIRKFMKNQMKWSFKRVK